jgi:predicted nucleic acid-binding Zn ribbon protein
MQKVSDAPLTVCEKCSGRLEKQWSLSGFQFKGEGWYVTDYSSKLKDKSAKTETAEKKSADESTAKTDTASKKSNDGTANSSKSSEKAEK